MIPGLLILGTAMALAIWSVCSDRINFLVKASTIVLAMWLGAKGLEMAF
jgi:hypothetical protein